jgi:hypothetical protein
VVKYLPAAAAVLLAIVFAFGALRTPITLACDRATCTYGDHTFRFADVREVRFVDGFGKHGDRAESQIIFASGRQISVGRGDADDARTIYQQLRAFFAPDGTRSFEITTSGNSWMWLLVAACVIAGGVLGVQAHGKRESHHAPRADWQKRKKYLLIGVGFVVVVAAIQLVILFVANQVQGTLVLECKQRCKFQGLECLPGGRSRQTLDEGTYQIEVWATAGSALWIPKSFTITTGETTTVVCE